MGFKMKPKSPLTKKLVSALKHKPWAAAHKERPAHSGTAEAHNAEPAAPTKKYVSDAQRKAVHASKADGGKGAPTKKREKKDFGTGDKKTERKLNRISRKINKQASKQFKNEDKGTKRGDRKADKAHAKGRKLLAKGRAIKKASDERTAESPVKKHKPGHPGGGLTRPKPKPRPRPRPPKPQPLPGKPAGRRPLGPKPLPDKADAKKGYTRTKMADSKAIASGGVVAFKKKTR